MIPINLELASKAEEEETKKGKFNQHRANTQYTQKFNSKKRENKETKKEHFFSYFHNYSNTHKWMWNALSFFFNLLVLFFVLILLKSNQIKEKNRLRSSCLLIEIDSREKSGGEWIARKTACALLILIKLEGRRNMYKKERKRKLNLIIFIKNDTITHTHTHFEKNVLFKIEFLHIIKRKYEKKKYIAKKKTKWKRVQNKIIKMLPKFKITLQRHTHTHKLNWK